MVSHGHVSIRRGRARGRNYTPYIELNLDAEGYNPLAIHYRKQLTLEESQTDELIYDIPWKGDKAEYPIQENCIELHKKKENELDQMDLLKSPFCIYVNEQNVPLDRVQKLLLSEQLTNRLVRDNIKAQITAAQNWLTECIDDHCLQSINSNNLLVQNIIYAIHHYAVHIEKLCRELIENGALLQEQCDNGKQNIIVNRIEEYCAKNKECMKFIANEIAYGRISLIPEATEQAYDYFNLYKEIDKANLEIYTPKKREAPADTSNLSPAVKEIIAIEKDQGDAVAEHPESVYTTLRPTQHDVNKAIATLQNVLSGKSLTSMGKFLDVCIPPPDQLKVQRAIALIPQLAKFDPWLEYNGYFRDIQISKSMD